MRALSQIGNQIQKRWPHGRAGKGPIHLVPEAVVEGCEAVGSELVAVAEQLCWGGDHSHSSVVVGES
jgi:hypothetical protein